jgi:hypothetical protein
VIRYLVVPGLLGPLPSEGDAGAIPRFPSLERLLARGEQSDAAGDYPRAMFQLFGLNTAPDRDVPTAAVCYQAEAGVPPLQGRYCLHADPLYLRPDQDRLLAYDFHHAPLSMDEAGQVAEAFNEHFAADGLTLLTPDPQRWYLLVDHHPQLHTRPLSDVLARNVDLFLPQGPDAGRWLGWLNEIQMLMHSLPLNRQREARGDLPVGGLWLSGGGVLPEARVRGFTTLHGEGQLLQGLNLMAEREDEAVVSVELGAQRAQCEGDWDAWVRAAARIDRRLNDWCREGLCLICCDGRAWHWQPGMRQRIWRRTRPIAHWLLAPERNRDPAGRYR